MIVLCFSMQGEDIFERTNGKCHVFISMQEEDIFEDASGSVICVHSSQLVDHFVT